MTYLIVQTPSNIATPGAPLVHDAARPYALCACNGDRVTRVVKRYSTEQAAKRRLREIANTR